MVNLAAIFAIFDLPDCAAEVLTRYREKIRGLANVDVMLDRLVEQENNGEGGYRRHLERFEHAPAAFLASRNPLVLAARGLKRGYRKWRGRRELFKMERSAP